jgi:hypothetical protein
MPSASVVTLVLGSIHHPPALSRTSSFVNMWIGCATPTLTGTKIQQDDDDEDERMRMRREGREREKGEMRARTRVPSWVRPTWPTS